MCAVAAPPVGLLALGVLICTALPGVGAHLGVTPDGANVLMANEEYLMCGKCTYGGDSSTTSATAWYQLTCDTAATKSGSWATLNYECNRDCSTCAKTTGSLTMGKEINATYKPGLFWSPYYSFLMTAASVQCCPQVIIESLHMDSTCTTTSTSVSKQKFTPAGCMIFVGNQSKAYDQKICTTDGAAPKTWRSDCTYNHYVKSTDVCPTFGGSSLSCRLSMSLENKPCLQDNTLLSTEYNTTNVNVVLSAVYPTTTWTCQIDGTQQCLRAVRSNYYTRNMTVGTDDISALSCLASNTGTTLGQSSAASSSQSSSSSFNQGSGATSLGLLVTIFVTSVALATTLW